MRTSVLIAALMGAGCVDESTYDVRMASEVKWLLIGLGTLVGITIIGVVVQMPRIKAWLVSPAESHGAVKSTSDAEPVGTRRLLALVAFIAFVFGLLGGLAARRVSSDDKRINQAIDTATEALDAVERLRRDMR